ncbi:MAG: helix-turn-helix domain-containing protein [Pantoea sp.]|nr:MULTISPECIES: helix-turn-helix domain-containing protein [Pantoea]MDU5781427.1 helix-turn-helix domain-containing protein [Pantoea sp.]
MDFQQRVEYIVRFLLSTQRYSKLDDLAEEIFISRSSLKKCMKEVRNILKNFNLDLQTKTAQGVKVTGDELNIRQAIANYLFYETDCIELNDGKPKTVRKKSPLF